MHKNRKFKSCQMNINGNFNIFFPYVEEFFVHSVQRAHSMWKPVLQKRVHACRSSSTKFYVTDKRYFIFERNQSKPRLPELVNKLNKTQKTKYIL